MITDLRHTILYSNNCTYAAVDTFNNAGTGIEVTNPATTVKPNSWIRGVKVVRTSGRLESMKHDEQSQDSVSNMIELFKCSKSTWLRSVSLGKGLHKLAFVFSALVFLISCNSPTKRLTANGSSSFIQIDLTDVKVKSNDKYTYSLVYAVFAAEIETNKALDLDCIKIEIDNNISEKVYVNSVASLNKNNLLANANGVVSHEVYWSFEGGITLDHKSLAKANLLFSKNFELECISEAIDHNGLYR